jgi:hypothetical protein
MAEIDMYRGVFEKQNALIVVPEEYQEEIVAPTEEDFDE